MKNVFKAALIALPLSLSLTGCIIVSTDEGTHADWMGNNHAAWEDTQKRNKQRIADLEVGDLFSEVRSDMGTPDFNEAYSQDGKKYQIIFYRTNRKHSDGQTTKDECTPLIFIDGQLSSWGHKAYNKL